ncbi:colicin immunity domain-containing protein [Rhodococcus sp. G-MC3]|uniref:colicin immunity domain-containing protein n=1 Tax=Rhodococcus sp. G-MC3 TaxID=3046209 RepID=UPI0024BA04FA|nr:colicin immunity domain-containing protein [Rhodococcus sp. G-MC3]MDJ0395023.1 colicin immunity domain-containing protein [Rhodococcus sp. G-MC3]
MTAPIGAAQQSTVFIPAIEDFVAGRSTAEEFEMRYLRLVRDTPGVFDREVSAAVNRLFSDVDAFVSEDRLRDEEDLDEQQLLASARVALIELTRLRDA